MPSSAKLAAPDGAAVSAVTPLLFHRLAVAFAAKRLVFALLSEHHSLVVGYETVADVGQRAASYADGVHLRHLVCYGAECRYGAERHAAEVHVEPRHDDADAPVGKFVAHGDQPLVEKLRLVDAHNLDVGRQEED